MSLYRNIIRRAVAISWDNKYLWFFGVFAALIGSGGYEIVGQSMASSADTIIWYKDFVDTGIFTQKSFMNIKDLAVADTSSLVVLGFSFAIILLVTFFFYWLAVVSQISIVSSTVNVLVGKDHSFQKSFVIGTKLFWPVFLINVLVKIAIFGVLIVVNMPLISSLFYNTSIDLNWMYILSVVVFVPALILFSFMMKYVIAYIVVKGDSVLTAMKRGWLLFYENWLVSIEMALILFSASFIMTILVIIAISVMILPATFLFYVSINFLGALPSLFFLVIFGLTALGIIILSASFNSVFQIAAWTDLFVELSGKGGASKLERMFGRYLHR